MGKRITDLGSEEFSGLFTGAAHTIYRLETLQRYDVRYEEATYRAFLVGDPPQHDPDRDEWTGMVRSIVAAGKTFQRVHLITEPLTDYLRYELEYWYSANTEAGEDIRMLPAADWPREAPQYDYWLFDSRDLWVMSYDDDGVFLDAEKIDFAPEIVRCNYWRDAARHHAMPYREYMNRALLRRAS